LARIFTETLVFRQWLLSEGLSLVFLRLMELAPVHAGVTRSSAHMNDVKQ
jgi:hypothetical protein